MLIGVTVKDSVQTEIVVAVVLIHSIIDASTGLLRIANV